MKNRDKSSTSITTLTIAFPLITLLLYGLLSHIFFFFSQNEETKKELIVYEKTLMETQKISLLEKVENLVQFIEYYDGRSSDKIKEDVKNIVNVTAGIANNIYQEHHHNIEENKLKEIIKSALQKIKFEGNIGYLFLLNLKGDAIIHVDKKIEGSNIMHIQDIHGKYILKEFNKVLKKDGEGFVDYYWYIINEDKKEMHYKISFVKMLDCYDWYIGAGEYLKYMKKFLQEDILKYIQANSKFKNGYFILNKKQKEGFYQDKKSLSYTRYIPRYDWYLTAYKNLSEITSNIERTKQHNNMKKNKNAKTNLNILLFTWVISLLLSIYLSMIVNRMRKSYEKELQNANEKLIFQSRQALIGELFSMIAHQWRQPINKIASILALLRFKLPQKSISYENIDNKCYQIEDSIEFMSETIDDFRTFYQPKDRREKIELKTLIEKSISFIDGSIKKQDIKIIKELENIEVNIYANEFLQVMINLIKNSIDALGYQGIIVIKLYKQNSKVMVIIKDNGTGIKKEVISKVFDPYYTTKKESMGLGLYMSKIIIEKHMNGIIKVERLSQGTKFTIEFEIS